MPNQTVDDKLRGLVLPYLLLPRLLQKTAYFRLHTLVTYATIIVGAIGGIGITSPLSDVVAGKPVTLDFTATPARMVIVTWTIAVLWVVVRAIYDYNNWGKCAALATSCTRAFRKCENDLEIILDQDEPLDDLNELYGKQIEPMVDQLVQEGALRQSLIDIRNDLQPAIEARAADLGKRHGKRWKEPPQEERRKDSKPGDGGNN